MFTGRSSSICSVKPSAVLTFITTIICTCLQQAVVNFRLLVAGDSVILFFAPEDTIQSCSDQLVSTDIGVVLHSEGVSPSFQSGNSEGLFSSKPPAAVMFVSSDR